jgi:neutrophil factor 2
MADLEDARREKKTPEHDVIDEAIKDRGDGYTVFSIVSPCS